MLKLILPPLVPESNLTPGITTYSLHPGVISTELGRHLDSAVFRGARAIYRTVSKPFIKTPELGAQTTIHCAVDEEAGKQSGLFYKLVILLLLLSLSLSFCYYV